MRKIIVSVNMSFDGIMAGAPPDGKVKADMGVQSYHLDWILPGVTEYGEDGIKIFDGVDTILLGRTTYEGLRQFWPTATGEYADRMNKTPKIVFAHAGSLKKVTWGDWDTITLIDKDVENAVKKLKKAPGKNMVIFASSKLVQSFTNANLIDEYRILVHPIILGRGKSLFEDIKKRHALKLIDSRRYSSGAILLDYEATGA